MFVIAKMKEDLVKPYATAGRKIPVVIESDHPRFVEGIRFDWGFVETAIKEGYIITIIP